VPFRSRRSRVLVAVVLLVLVGSGLAGSQAAGARRDPVGTARTWFWKARYRLLPIDDEKQLAALHLDTARGTREQCVACHEDKTGSMLVLHRIHLRNPLLSKLACRDCHQHVDLGARDNRAVVTWVDVGFCKKCHSPFPGLSKGSKMRPQDFDSPCSECHKGDRAPKHDQPYLPAVIPSSECKGCHGGRVLPSAARHEQADWMQIHGQEALRVGADSCYQCHDFGLKFCDACHGKKPPSHLPAERWRQIHPDAAKADTRVCYSCHKVGFCKTCHLNHEQGWLENHSAFVTEKGDSSCGECHSASACTYCHMRDGGTADSTATP